MDIQELRREAQTMQPQLTADRRRLHRNPEAGAVLPETVAYVKERLTEMGYHPQELGGGLTATVTPQMKTVLDYLAEYGEMTDEDLQELLNVKKTRAYLLARQMRENGLIEIVGRGAEKKYKLK